MANKILHTTIMQKNTNGGKNIIYPKTVTKNIIDGSSTLDQTLNILKSDDVSNKTTTFTQADTRQNLVSGETLATSQGKIMKLISDLKSLAYRDTIGVSNLDSALASAYNNRVTTDMITTSTAITSDGYVADARAVNNLQNQINTVNSNMSNYWCLNGGTYIAPDTNLDDIRAIGSYFNHNDAESKTIINNPVDTAFTLQIYASNGQAAYYVTQELRSIYIDGGIFIRKFDRYTNKWTEWDRLIFNSDLVYKEITSDEFSPVANISFQRAYYFKIGKMVTVYIDIIVNNGFTLSKETAISGNIFPVAIKTSYVSINAIGQKAGYGFFNQNSGTFCIYATTEGRHFIHFSYPTT